MGVIVNSYRFHYHKQRHDHSMWRCVNRSCKVNCFMNENMELLRTNEYSILTTMRRQLKQMKSAMTPMNLHHIPQYPKNPRPFQMKCHKDTVRILEMCASGSTVLISTNQLKMMNVQSGVVQIRDVKPCAPQRRHRRPCDIHKAQLQ